LNFISQAFHTTEQKEIFQEERHASQTESVRFAGSKAHIVVRDVVVFGAAVFAAAAFGYAEMLQADGVASGGPD
jgi:hypothetical protein